MSEQKEKLLIVDDSEMNRAILREILDANYEIIEAEDGLQGVELLEQFSGEISAVLLDLVMPRMDGFGVLQAMNLNRWIENIPVIVISAERAGNLVERAFDMGVTDFIVRPFDELIVRRRVQNTTMLYAKQKKLVGMVEEQLYARERQTSLMVDILSHIVEFRNGESGLHVLHIRRLTEIMLGYLPRLTDRYPIARTDVAVISLASALHDVGKIAIPSEILNKPGRLTAEECVIMKQHSAIGGDMMKSLTNHQNEPLVKAGYEICRWHHERYDGRGYPDGLKGDAIPISAQIVALADVYDALTSERSYKKAIEHEKAVDMILNGECGAFNPLLLTCLRQLADTLPKALNSDRDGASIQHLTYEALHFN